MQVWDASVSIQNWCNWKMQVARMLQVVFIVLLSYQNLYNNRSYFIIQVLQYSRGWIPQAHCQMPGVTALLLGTNCLEISF